MDNLGAGINQYPGSYQRLRGVWWSGIAALAFLVLQSVGCAHYEGYRNALQVFGNRIDRTGQAVRIQNECLNSSASDLYHVRSALHPRLAATESQLPRPFLTDEGLKARQAVLGSLVAYTRFLSELTWDDARKRVPSALEALNRDIQVALDRLSADTRMNPAVSARYREALLAFRATLMDQNASWRTNERLSETAVFFKEDIARILSALDSDLNALTLIETHWAGKLEEAWRKRAEELGAPTPNMSQWLPADTWDLYDPEFSWRLSRYQDLAIVELHRSRALSFTSVCHENLGRLHTIKLHMTEAISAIDVANTALASCASLNCSSERLETLFRELKNSGSRIEAAIKQLAAIRQQLLDSTFP